MPRVDVYLADPAGLLEPAAFDAAATIDIERSDDAGESFAPVDDITITTTATQPFSLWDADGDGDSLYRWRVSSADDAIHSEYSTPFPGVLATATVPARAYASLADVMDLFKTKPLPVHYPRLANLIGVATDECIRAMGGRDYFRHPTIGTETWTTEGVLTDVIHAHDGIVSLDTVEVSVDGGQSFVELEADAWILEGAVPGDSSPGRDGDPYFHLRLTFPFMTVSSFSRRSATTRLTGARGRTAIPAQLREGVKGRVRQLAAADNALAGILSGPSEYGGGQGGFEYWPQVLYRFLQDESERFMPCSL